MPPFTYFSTISVTGWGKMLTPLLLLFALHLWGITLVHATSATNVPTTTMQCACVGCCPLPQYTITVNVIVSDTFICPVTVQQLVTKTSTSTTTVTLEQYVNVTDVISMTQTNTIIHTKSVDLTSTTTVTLPRTFLLKTTVHPFATFMEVFKAVTSITTKTLVSTMTNYTTSYLTISGTFTSTLTTTQTTILFSDA